jgi:hypothetical protein
MNHFSNRSVMLILSTIYMEFNSHAQEHTPHAAWLLPGVDVNASDHLRLRNQPGYNHYLKTGIWYSQAYIPVHKNIILNPGYIYSLRKMEDSEWLQEHYLMNAVILQAKKKNFMIDDRNMLWNRITVGDKARHYYRNRLRLIQSFKTGSITTRVYGYDEIFLLYKHENLSRNRAAVGVNSDLTVKLNIDITYVRQWDRYTGTLNLYFIAAIWQW